MKGNWEGNKLWGYVWGNSFSNVSSVGQFLKRIPQSFEEDITNHLHLPTQCPGNFTFSIFSFYFPFSLYLFSSSLLTELKSPKYTGGLSDCLHPTDKSIWNFCMWPYLGKRIGVDISEDFKMRSSWVIQVDPKTNSKCLFKKRKRHRQEWRNTEKGL